MKSRDFVGACAGGAALSGRSQTANEGSASSRAAKLAGVRAMSGCFGRLLADAWGHRAHVDPPAMPNDALDIMDLPEMLADRYGIHYVELKGVVSLLTRSADPREGHSNNNILDRSCGDARVPPAS